MARKPKKISAAWAKRFARLPGYDPVATAATGQYFDAAAADRACEFFPLYLRHIEGSFAGSPFELGDWQKAIIGCLFGWKRADGTRRYRTAFLGIPRGNGKTPLAAGICDFVLFCDGEPGAQIYGAAADAGQAGLLFRHAKGFIDREPHLAGLCRVYPGGKSIVLNRDANTVYKVVSSDAAGKHGYTPHVVLADELHAWQGRELMEAFETAFAKKGRRQPLFIIITTRDVDGRESPCNEKWHYAEQVRDGLVSDDSFLPVLFAANDDDPWDDEATWAKANPNLDITVDLAELRRMVDAARLQPAKESSFRRLHLNQKTDAANPWMALATWDACKVDIDLAYLRGQQCVGGLDLSSTMDITAWVLVFHMAEMPDGTRRTVALPRFFIPSDGASDKERKDHALYRTWARSGLVTMTPGASVDYDFIRAQVNRDQQEYSIRAIAADRYNAQQLCTQLIADGIEVLYVPQSITMLNGPTKELERAIVSKEFAHDGNPMFRWMLANCVTVTDATGNTRLDKRKSTGRIDGLAATVNAMSCVLAGIGTGSVYESRGLLSI